MGTDAAGFPIGAHGTTPGVRTDVPGLALAGDWVAAPFPCALMERAAVTGIIAANTILAARGYGTEPVWSVPRGVCSPGPAAAAGAGAGGRQPAGLAAVRRCWYPSPFGSS